MKYIIKLCMHYTAVLAVSPFILLCRLMFLIGNQDGVLSAFSQLMSLLPGKTGSYLRAAFYRFTMSACEPEVFIGFGSLFSQRDTNIAAGVYIGPQCNIGKCSIGEDTLLGSAVHIMSGKQQHNFAEIDAPIREQGGTFTKVSIGKNCWLGNGALVMSNIGDNCIIAAGSVVVNDIPSNSIAAGNPAKVIKTRS